MSQHEVVDIVDQQNAVLYQTTKEEAHAKGLLHRTVIAVIKDSSGKWPLVRQAADRQDAGQFVLPVGGHVQAGETEEAALRRETVEETGLTEFDCRLIGNVIYQRHVLNRDENHYFSLFEIDSDESLVLGDEAVEYRRFSEIEIQQILLTNPEIFGDSFHFHVQEFYPRLLPQTELVD